MKTKLLYTILATTMLIANSLQSAEVIPVWSKIRYEENPNPDNLIHDMEFLRGEDQFIFIAGIRELGVIEIRETLTGELVRSLPLPTLNYFNQIEITPDSNRIVLAIEDQKVNVPALELRNIDDFAVINRLVIKMDADSVDPVGNPYYYRFRDIVIDPIKPYIYAFLEKTNHIADEYPNRTWLKVYNYETMEEVKDLTPEGYEYEQMKCMDVSDDGRQLAVINEGKTYLKIWELENGKLIKDFKIYDDGYCLSDDIEFSSNNNNLIYFSGKFPNSNVEYNPYGFYKFSLISNRIEKDIPSENYINGKFTLFSNEEKVLISNGVMFSIINQLTEKQEIFQKTNIKYPMGVKNLYSNRINIFLGYAEYLYGAFKYDSQTSKQTEYEEEIIINPNPTNNFVSINLNCIEPIVNYQINDINGLLLFQNTTPNQVGNSLQINFTPYPIGVYFITITCGNELKSYKVVRE